MSLVRNEAKELNAPQHLERFRDFYHDYRSQADGIKKLKMAISHLAMAASLDYSFARSALRSPHSVTASSIDTIYHHELIARLNEVPKESSLFLSAQYELFLRFYKLRYYKVYANYQDRFQDLHQALLHLANIMHGNQNDKLINELAKKLSLHVDVSTAIKELIKITWKNLAREACGEDVLASLNLGHELTFYHYRMMPESSIASSFQGAVDDSKKLGSLINIKMQQLTQKTSVNMSLTSVKIGRYVLPLVTEALFKDKNILVFTDKQSQQEIIRFERSAQRLRVTAYGDSIKLQLSDQLNFQSYSLHNLNGEFEIDYTQKNDLSLLMMINAKKTLLNGQLQTSKSLKLRVNGELSILKSATLSAPEIDINADDLDLSGNIRGATIQLGVTQAMTQDPDSVCYADTSCRVNAGCITNMRGEIRGDDLLAIKVKTGLYLHGRGSVSSTKDVVIHAQQLMITDKAQIQAKNSLRLLEQAKLFVDKNAIIYAPIMMIQVEAINNYAHIAAPKYLEIQANELINHEHGIIETSGIGKLSGGSVWNGGTIKGGKLVGTLNKLWVHGVSSKEELISKVRKGRYAADIIADHVSITAACYIELLSQTNTKSLTINALVNFGVGVTRALTTNESSLISVNYGITIPKLDVYLQNLQEYMHLISQGEYLKALDRVCTWESATSALNFARWIMRTLLPTLSRPIDLVWSMAMLAKRLPSVYKQLHDLYQKNDKIELHELIALSTTAASLTTQVSSLVTQIEGEYHDISDSLARTGALPPVDLVWPEKTELALVLDCVGLFAPISTNDSLVRVGGGVDVAGSEINRSLFVSDSAEIVLALSVSDQFYASVQHARMTVANNISEIGVYSNTSGVTVSNQLTGTVTEQKHSGIVLSTYVKLEGDNIYNDAKIHSHDIKMSAKEGLEQNGNLKADKTTLVGHDVIMTANSHLQGNDVTVKGEDIHDAGSIKAKTVVESAAAALQRADTADIQAQTVHLHSDQQLTDGGIITVVPSDQPVTTDKSEPAVIIDAKSVTTTETSNVNADGQIVVITGEHISEAGHVQSRIVINHADNDLTLTATAQQQAGDVYVAAKEADINANFHTQADQLHLNVEHLTGQSWEDILTSTEHHGLISAKQAIVVDTHDSITLDHNHDFNTVVAVKCAALNFNGTSLHSQENLSFSITDSDFTLNHQQIHSEKTLVFDCAKSFYNNYGTVQGRETYISAQGDIVNRSGTLQGLDYLQLYAGGDIQNLCTEHDVRGAYDMMKSYDVGHIIGGTGVGHEGVGLAAYAGNKVINTASEIRTQGTNSVYADKGIFNTALTHDYVSFHRKSHSWWGGTTEKTDISTQVQKAFITSTNGSNILGGGHIYSCATDLIAKAGTDIFADKENVELLGLVTETRQYRNQDGLFGLIHDHTRDSQQHAVPTRVVSLGDIRIHAKEDVIGDNAYFDTANKFKVRARSAYFAAPVLDFLHEESYSALGVNGLSPSQLGFAPLVDDAKSLGDSTDSMDAVINSWNTGIDAANSANSLMTADRSGHPLAAILPPDTPVGGVGFSRGHDKQTGQRVAGNSGINCKDLDIKVDDRLTFDRLPVHVKRDAHVNADDFYQNGARLSSTHTHDVDKFNIDLALNGNWSGSAGRAKSRDTSTSEQNQSFDVGRALDVNVHNWHINNANTSEHNLTGHVDHLFVKSDTDQASHSGYAVQAGTDGNFAFQSAKGKSAWIGQPSGIETEDSDIVLDTADLQGGVIYVNGKNHTVIGHLTRTAVDEYSHGYTFGLSGNIHAFDHDKQSSNPFSTLSVRYGRTDVAGQQDAYFGKGHVGDHQGQSISHQVQYDHHIKVPIYNAKGMDQFKDNLQYESHRFFPVPAHDAKITPTVISNEHPIIHHRQQVKVVKPVVHANPVKQKVASNPLLQVIENEVKKSHEAEDDSTNSLQCFLEMLRISRSVNANPERRNMLYHHAIDKGGDIDRHLHELSKKLMTKDPGLHDKVSHSASVDLIKSAILHGGFTVPGTVKGVVKDVALDEVICPTIHDVARYDKLLDSQAAQQLSQQSLFKSHGMRSVLSEGHHVVGNKP
jgi:hypothetical protein